jgi:hypothetical protein
MAFTIPTELQLNLGAYPNDGTGDDLYTAFKKVKDTLILINSELDDTGGANLGAGAAIFAGKSGNNLTFKTITGTGVTVTQTANTVNLSALTNLLADTNPSLGGNLNLNSRNITGTGNITITGAITVSNVNALVYNIDIRQLKSQVDAGLGGANVDFGTFDIPAPGDQDFGRFD